MTYATTFRLSITKKLLDMLLGVGNSGTGDDEDRVGVVESLT